MRLFLCKVLLRTSQIQGRPNIDLFIFEAQLSSKNHAGTAGSESRALQEWMRSLYERTAVPPSWDKPWALLAPPSLKATAWSLHISTSPVLSHLVIYSSNTVFSCPAGTGIAPSQNLNPTSRNMLPLRLLFFILLLRSVSCCCWKLCSSAWPYKLFSFPRSPPKPLPSILFDFICFPNSLFFTAALWDGSKRREQVRETCSFRWEWEELENVGGGRGDPASSRECWGRRAEDHHGGEIGGKSEAGGMEAKGEEREARDWAWGLSREGCSALQGRDPGSPAPPRVWATHRLHERGQKGGGFCQGQRWQMGKKFICFFSHELLSDLAVRVEWHCCT